MQLNYIFHYPRINRFGTNVIYVGGANFHKAGGTDPTKIMPNCPDTLDESNDPVKTLTQAPTWADFISANNDDDYYWWDADKGMLFFYVEQKKPNLTGPTPLGSCPDANNPACEYADQFYACPEEGCVLYTVRVVDGGGSPIDYAPTRVENDYGATTCDDIYQGNITEGPTTDRDYTQTYPPNDTVTWEPDRLALLDGTVLTSDKINPFADNEGEFFCNFNLPAPPAPACAEPAELSICRNNFPYNLPDASVDLNCPDNAPAPYQN